MLKLKKKIVFLTLGLAFAGNVAAFTLDGDMQDVLDTAGLDWHDWQNSGVSYLKDGELQDENQLRSDQIAMKYEKYGASGGYKWDHMAMYMALDGDNLYVSVLTGAPPDLDTRDGNPNTAVGDLAIRTGEAATLADWEMSRLTSGDYSGHYQADGDDFYGIQIPNYYSNTPETTDVLRQPVWDAYNDTPTSITPTTGTDVGDAQVVYTKATLEGKKVRTEGYASRHRSGQYDWQKAWFMEAFIPLASLGYHANDSVIQVAAWLSFNCSNDRIFLSHTFNRHSGGNPPPGVPEPAPLAIMALGMVGMGFARKHARRK